MATCYRHPNRETGVSCSNCGRPICPDCMTPTPVGMRCPECASQRTKVVRMREMSSRPEVTIALIAINVVAFLLEGGGFSVNGSAGGELLRKGATLGSGLVQLSTGQIVGEGVAYQQYYRVITGGFLHENLLHIGFNMWVLYVLGVQLEPALGRLRYGLVYLVSLLAGSLGALIVTPHAVTVGASGAVFGIMGATAVEMRARQIPIMQSGVGGLIFINLIISFTLPGISWGGHVGGLIGGALAALVLRASDRAKVPQAAIAGLAAMAVVLALASVAVSNSSKVLPPPLSPGSSGQLQSPQAPSGAEGAGGEGGGEGAAR